VLLSDLIPDLRFDLSDPDASRFDDRTLERCIQKAVFRVGLDLSITLTITAGEIIPEPSGEVRELLLIMARIHVCQVMRSATANAFSFSSGDKRVDKTGQPGHWTKLEADLLVDYQQWLKQVNKAT
jgi:hypothetical protein